MEIKFEYYCPTVGSDEANTGGLFGSAVYVAVRITHKTLIQLEESKILEKLEENDLKKIREIAKLMEKIIPKEDIEKWIIQPFVYNNMIKQHKTKLKIDCIVHNYLHKKLKNNYTFHTIDDFLNPFNKGIEYWYDVPESKKDRVEIIKIHAWVQRGEKSFCSIRIAEILAINYAVDEFEKVKEYLKIREELDGDENHFYQLKGKKLKHPERLKKIETILKKLKKKEISEWCKHDLLQKVEEYSEDNKIKRIIREILNLNLW